jgi:catechol 2,3-dioxygenase-like lactoylglutathione lyase family enzyme
MGVWDNFCWGIEPWDTNKVEAELRKRGLNPVADHSGDFKSFHVKDPDGFDVQVSNGTKANRWKGAANGKLPAPAPFEPTGWKTVWLDHISFQVSDYKRSVAFYQALLGWKPRSLTGNQAMTDIGDVGGVIIRGGGGGGGRGRGGGADSAGRGAPPPAPAAPRMARIDHISFGIEPWDADKVEAELIKRGLGRMRNDGSGHLTPDTGGGGDIHTSRFQSYHTPDPFGWDLQISNITFETRNNT